MLLRIANDQQRNFEFKFEGVSYKIYMRNWFYGMSDQVKFIGMKVDNLLYDVYKSNLRLKLWDLFSCLSYFYDAIKMEHEGDEEPVRTRLSLLPAIL